MRKRHILLIGLALVCACKSKTAVIESAATRELRRNNPIGAIRQYSRLIPIRPAAAYNARGLVLEKMGHLAMSRQDYLRAIKSDPTFCTAYINLSMVEIRMREPEAALLALDTSDPKCSATPEFAIARSAAYFHLQRYAESRAEAEKALRYLPDNKQAHFNRGMALFNQKVYQTSADSFGNAIRCGMKTSSSYYWRGRAEKEAGSLASATQDFTKAIKLNPHFFEAYLYRADTLKAIGYKRGEQEDRQLLEQNWPALKAKAEKTPQKQ